MKMALLLGGDGGAMVGVFLILPHHLKYAIILTITLKKYYILYIWWGWWGIFIGIKEKNNCR